MEAYKILKVPIAKDKAVFYYYKPYVPKSGTESTTLVSLPADRSIYVCHFLKPLTEDILHKLFGIVGKLKQIHIGEYKNKANNKRKRRTVYFAIVVYKNAEDCQTVLNEPKYLQAKVNKVMKKSAKFSRNPFAREDGSDGEDSEHEDGE